MVIIIILNDVEETLMSLEENRHRWEKRYLSIYLISEIILSLIMVKNLCRLLQISYFSNFSFLLIIDTIYFLFGKSRKP